MITKEDIVRKIYERSDKKISLDQINDLVTFFFSEVTQNLEKKEEVYIKDFGTLSLTEEIKKPVVKYVNKK